MRYINNILIAVCLIVASNISAQDTIGTTVDTLICSDYNSEYYFHSLQDTALYDSEWFLFGVADSISSGDSIIINDIDSILLYSRLLSEPDSVLLIDTIFFRLRFIPEIIFEIPEVTCFDGDSLVLKDLSNVYGDYTMVSYSLSGDPLAAIDSLIEVFVDNGDSTTLSINYSLAECMVSIDTSVVLQTDFQPVSDFEATVVCFGDSTLIVNESDFEIDSSTFLMTIDGLTSFDTSMDTFSVLLLDNAIISTVFVEIVQGACTTLDTFMIGNKLQPTAMFSAEKACENELLSLNNLSTKIASISSYSFVINGELYSFENSTSFMLSDTLADSVYPTIGIVNNNNGCLDSVDFSILIDSVTYISFSNLDDEYCELQDESILDGSVQAGMFSGQFVSDFGNTGKASFVPTSPAMNISVLYSYTNSEDCTDQEIQVVSIIHPKPQLELQGLLPAYCELDPSTELTLNQSISSNSIFEITKDGQFFDGQTDLTYKFDPVSSGLYRILNVYTDENECFDSIINVTRVNPLPIVLLDSLTVIKPGETIQIGNTAGTEAGVVYEWTDGSDMSTLDVRLPGIYILRAINTATTCEASDTSKIEFDTLIETELVKIQISPNPTQDIINISVSSPAQNITLLDRQGQVVSINGSSSFSTDSNGELTLDLSNESAGYYYLIIPEIGNFLLVKV